MNNEQHLNLFIENLEDRMMLSTVQVFATGATGDEQFALEVNGQVSESFDVTTSQQSYTIQWAEAIDPNVDTVRVQFLNDLYIEGEVDRDLIVDKIIVDGVTYESEAATTYSTGTWVGEGLPNEGFLESEILNITGYFEYEAATDLIIRASGDEGTETTELQIDEQVVSTIDLTTSFTDYLYRHYGELTPDQIRVSFSGDEYDPANNVDKNVNVDWLSLDGILLQSESPSVYSTGTWTAEDGIQPGFGRGETLHTDGYFQFGTAIYEDTFQIPEDALSVPLAVLANDNLVAQQEIEVAVEPQNGTVELVAGELRYTPNSEFTGIDNFRYRVIGKPGSVLVNVEVQSSHQQPQHLLNDQVAAELTPSGKFLVVEKVVQLPRGEDDRQARMNSMTTLGDRIFVVADGNAQGEGQIYEVTQDSNGDASVELFLDVGTAVFANTGLFIDNSSPLNGLRSVAFHPRFSANGKFYVTYTGQRPTEPIGTKYISDPVDPVDVESVLAEFAFDFDAGQVDVNSYREVFRVGMRNSEHSIRQAVFNPYSRRGDEDYGLIYIGHGDGSEQSAVSGDGLNNDALGKILRVNPLQSGIYSYTIRATNPFISDPTMIREAFAIGFRNPHNLTFAEDANRVSHLIVTEIGRDNIEEINVVEKGASYGWGDREGPFVHDPISGTINGINNLPANEALNGYTFPNALWGHEGIVGESFVGQAIAGGHVIQNGSSELDDQFVFLEFATDGRAYHIDFSEMLQQVTTLAPNEDPSELTWLTPQELTILFDHDNDDSTTALVRSSLKDVLDDEPDFEVIESAGKVRADLRLGQGPNGELYILNKRNGWLYVATNTQ